MKRATPISVGLFILFTLLFGGCSKSDLHGQGTAVTESPSSPKTPTETPDETLISGDVPAPDERMITILGTNDIHGGVEPRILKDGTKTGGMAIWSGIVTSIRKGMTQKWGERGGVLVVDAGDQFQGTLISNFDEGELVFDLMGMVGYDAAVPGNHDYDFGPVGWLDDRVLPGMPKDADKRGALWKLVQKNRFPLISANTYFRTQMTEKDTGRKLTLDEVDAIGCKSKAKINWDAAERPAYVSPYAIKTVAGVRVALVGLDNPLTSTTTTRENVDDLCFRDEEETYLEVRKKLEGQADVFVIVMHVGNSNVEFGASSLARKLTQKPGRVDAIVAGHTHFVNEEKVNGVPIIQSRSGGEMFGRIDLVWDARGKKLIPEKMRYDAGVSMPHGRCADSEPVFCTVDKSSKKPMYDGIEAAPDPKIEAMIEQRRKDPVFASLAEMKLGHADQTISSHRINESALANAMTDVARGIGAEQFAKKMEQNPAEVVALINTGGIRAPIPAGEITYEDLYRVLPFNNHHVLAGPMEADRLIALLKRSIDTCGSRGALMQSGLRVTFERTCPQENKSSGLMPSALAPSSLARDVDPNAKLLRVETLAGELIYDASRGKSKELVVSEDRIFWTVTLDFLSQGGSGYKEFVEFRKRGAVPVTEYEPVDASDRRSIFREAVVDHYRKFPAKLSSQLDGRWKKVEPSGLGSQEIH